MTDIEFAALLVSRVCHDLVSPIGAVVNGLEVLEDERDPAMRADALKLVASSAAQAAARLQFARLAFGAAGSAGAHLDLTELGRIVRGLVEGSKVSVEWKAAPLNWPKNWAKLLMNATVLAADCLPRGGRVTVTTLADPATPGFTIYASGSHVRLHEEVDRVVRGDGSGELDGRSIQAFLTHRLARTLNATLTLKPGDGQIEITAA